MAPSYLAYSGLALRAAIKRDGVPGAGADAQAATADSGLPTGVKIAIIVLAVLALGGIIVLRFRSGWKKRAKTQYAAKKLEESAGDR
ncbi:hypothetical protein B0H16DRAFT_1714481 [Mycena metata]|uniref:Uncharacterized protein n=1 Tax=Mycena metata TaxID=1033252 RepID=A0AAD7NS13_9AGAR|nr:hypothetical protein B0H16DRAFT_1714481 [Mycena metata]